MVYRFGTVAPATAAFPILHVVLVLPCGQALPVQDLPVLRAILAVLGDGHPGAKQRLHNGPLLVDRPPVTGLLLDERHAEMFLKQKESLLSNPSNAKLPK